MGGPAGWVRNLGEGARGAEKGAEESSGSEGQVQIRSVRQVEGKQDSATKGDWHPAPGSVFSSLTYYRNIPPSQGREGANAGDSGRHDAISAATTMVLKDAPSTNYLMKSREWIWVE